MNNVFENIEALEGLNLGIIYKLYKTQASIKLRFLYVVKEKFRPIFPTDRNESEHELPQLATNLTTIRSTMT